MPCYSILLRRLLRVVPFLLALACLAPRAFALTKTFDSTVPAAMRLIDSNDVTYEGYDIIVSGVTVTINGTHSFASLLVQNGGVVTHAPGLVSGMNLTIAGNMTVGINCSVNANGAGYPGGQGPGAGKPDTTGSYGGGGASYGGSGTSSSAAAGTLYGDLRNPIALGSGGGSGYGGSNSGSSGGGAIRLTVNGVLQVDGRLEANGNDGNHAGAGSGGSLLLTVGALTGSGLLRTYGGYSSRYNTGGPSGGSGGGGRIALYYTVNNFGGYIVAAGNSSDNYGRAAAGTIFLKQTSQTNGDLWITNDGSLGVGTILDAPATFDNVRVFGSGALASPYLGILDVTILQNCTVETGSYISASGRGYAGGQGPGHGNNEIAGSTGGAGGSFGGEGTNTTVLAGSTYGKLKDPIGPADGTHSGSGGGSGFGGSYGGGAGGGAIRLTVNGVLQVDGRLEANGNDGNHAGAGSGGSLLLSVGTLTGAGYVTTYGGYSSRYNTGGPSGGGGGGGRIALYYANSLAGFTGTLSAAGGGSDNYGRAGAGTIFVKQPTQTQGDLWVQNDANVGAGTVLNEPYTFDNIRVWNQGRLTPPYNGSLNLTILGNCIIQSGGYITASSRGYAGSQGVGKGSDDSTGNGGGGGGGYGGLGKSGSASGGIVYGSQTLPIDLGSGGGSGFGGSYGGGAGGGAIRLTVNGVLQVDGRLEANGNDGNHAGAGSGGSLLLSVGTLTGAGYVTTYGGYSSRYNTGGPSGGGGGGGRIALYYANSLAGFTGTLSAAGGGSDNYGTATAGTIYTQKTAGNLTIALVVNPTLLGGGQQATGNITLSKPAPTGGINIALASSDTTAATVPSSVTIAEGETNGVFAITANSVSVAKTTAISAQLYDQTQSVAVNVKPWLGALRLNPGSVTGGQTATGTLTLNLPAPSGGLLVSLASSDPALTFPNGATLTLAAGTTTQNFSVRVGSVSPAKSATITATYLAENQSASVYLNPAGVLAQSVAVAPGSVVGGATATGVVTLNNAAPSGGSLVALSSSDTSIATLPAFVLVAAGQTSAAFTIKTVATSTLKSVIISATLGVTQITTLSVRGPGVASLTLIPAAIIGGSNSIGIVTLEAPATAPLTITISSNQSAAVPAASVIIPIGQTTGNFTIATSVVTSATTALLTARANGTAKSQSLALYPIGTKLAIAVLSGVVTLEGCVNPAQQITFVLRPADGTANQTLTTTLGSDGSFAFSAILTQKYNVWIKGAKWLAKVVAVDASGGGASGITVTLPAADANNDNFCDATDFGVLVSAYNTDSAIVGSGYDPAADFNCDGAVDATDFGLLVGNYNTAGDN